MRITIPRLPAPASSIPTCQRSSRPGDPSVKPASGRPPALPGVDGWPRGGTLASMWGWRRPAERVGENSSRRHSGAPATPAPRLHAVAPSVRQLRAPSVGFPRRESGVRAPVSAGTSPGAYRRPAPSSPGGRGRDPEALQVEGFRQSGGQVHELVRLALLHHPGAAACRAPTAAADPSPGERAAPRSPP